MFGDHILYNNYIAPKQSRATTCIAYVYYSAREVSYQFGITSKNVIKCNRKVTNETFICLNDQPNDIL